jgi:hypothetical protein
MQKGIFKNKIYYMRWTSLNAQYPHVEWVGFLFVVLNVACVTAHIAWLYSP